MEEILLRKEVYELIINFSSTILKDKSYDEMRVLIKNAIKVQIDKAKQNLNNTKFMTISSAHPKREYYQKLIDKLERTLKVFDEEFDKFVSGAKLNKTYHEINESMNNLDSQELLESIINETSLKFGDKLNKEKNNDLEI